MEFRDGSNNDNPFLGYHHDDFAVGWSMHAFVWTCSFFLYVLFLVLVILMVPPTESMEFNGIAMHGIHKPAQEQPTTDSY